jgi:hypothetical protein
MGDLIVFAIVTTTEVRVKFHATLTVARIQPRTTLFLV